MVVGVQVRCALVVLLALFILGGGRRIRPDIALSKLDLAAHGRELEASTSLEATAAADAVDLPGAVLDDEDTHESLADLHEEHRELLNARRHAGGLGTLDQGTALEEVLAQKGDPFKDAWKGVTNVAKDAGKGITNVAKDAGKGITNVAKDAGKGIKNAADDVGDWAENAADDVGDWAEDAVDDVGDWTEAAVGEVAKTAKAVTKKVTNHVHDLVKDVGGAVGKALKDIGEKAISQLSKWAGTLHNRIDGAFKLVSKGVTFAMRKVSELSKMPGPLKTLIDSAIKVYKNQKELWMSRLNFVKNFSTHLVQGDWDAMAKNITKLAAAEMKSFTGLVTIGANTLLKISQEAVDWARKHLFDLIPGLKDIDRLICEVTMGLFCDCSSGIPVSKDGVACKAKKDALDMVGFNKEFKRDMDKEWSTKSSTGKRSNQKKAPKANFNNKMREACGMSAEGDAEFAGGLEALKVGLKAVDDAIEVSVAGEGFTTAAISLKAEAHCSFKDTFSFPKIPVRTTVCAPLMCFMIQVQFHAKLEADGHFQGALMANGNFDMQFSATARFKTNGEPPHLTKPVFEQETSHAMQGDGAFNAQVLLTVGPWISILPIPGVPVDFSFFARLRLLAGGTLSVGTGDPQLSRKELGPPVMEPASCRAELFQHGGFAGRSAVFHEGEYGVGHLNSSGLGNDQMSSMKVIGGIGCVTQIWEHDRKGKTAVLEVGEYDIVELGQMFGNDILSHVKVHDLQKAPMDAKMLEVPIGSSTANKKCVELPPASSVICDADAGNKGRRTTGNQYNDRFKITVEEAGRRVCAKRLDYPNGWGLHLKIHCTKVEVRKLFFVGRHMNWGTIDVEQFETKFEADRAFARYNGGPKATMQAQLFGGSLKELNYYGGRGGRDTELEADIAKAARAAGLQVRVPKRFFIGIHMAWGKIDVRQYETKSEADRVFARHNGGPKATMEAQLVDGSLKELRYYGARGGRDTEIVSHIKQVARSAGLQVGSLLQETAETEDTGVTEVRVLKKGEPPEIEVFLQEAADTKAEIRGDNASLALLEDAVDLEQDMEVEVETLIHVEGCIGFHGQVEAGIDIGGVGFPETMIPNLQEIVQEIAAMPAKVCDRMKKYLSMDFGLLELHDPALNAKSNASYAALLSIDEHEVAKRLNMTWNPLKGVQEVASKAIGAICDTAGEIIKKVSSVAGGVDLGLEKLRRTSFTKDELERLLCYKAFSKPDGAETCLRRVRPDFDPCR